MAVTREPMGIFAPLQRTATILGRDRQPLSTAQSLPTGTGVSLAGLNRAARQTHGCHGVNDSLGCRELAAP